MANLNDEQTMDEQDSDIPTSTSLFAKPKKSKASPSYQIDPVDTDTSVSSSQRYSMINSTIGFNEGDNEYALEETIGEAPITTGGVESAEESAEFSEEITNPDQESGEEYYESSLDQLNESYTEESNEEGLFDVIGNVLGGLLGGESEEIREVGTAIEGGFENGQEAGSQEEIFPFLAALVPTLISSVGPVVAKGVMRKLSPRAKVGVKKLAASAPKVVGGKIPRAGRNILSMFAKFLEAASEKPTNESGEELGEELASLINEAAAAMEVIIGTDDRKRIPNTTRDPWRRICALRITFPSGKTYRGTGFFIGSKTIATAGHCVYLHNQGGWARKVEVIPGANGAEKPYGSSVSTSFRSVKGWVNGKKPEHDYGCIVLSSGSFGGRKLGRFGFGSYSSQVLLAKSAILSGYPGDKPFSEQWGMRRKIKTVTGKTLIYDIDTVGGQSGAPVYIKLNGKRYVVGIHNYGNSTGNSATRITPAVFNNLKKWSVI